MTSSTNYTVVAESGSTTYTLTITVTPSGSERCELTMTFAGSTTGLIGQLLTATVGRLMTGATRRAIQRDLDDLAARAQQRHPT